MIIFSNKTVARMLTLAETHISSRLPLRKGSACSRVDRKSRAFPLSETRADWLSFFMVSSLARCAAHQPQDCPKSHWSSPSSLRSWPLPSEKANSLLLPLPMRYPEPQNTVPFTIDGPQITEPPLANFHRMAPLLPSIATMSTESDPA